MWETEAIHVVSHEKFADIEKIKSEILETKSFDMSKLKLLPPESLEKTLVELRSEQLQKVEKGLHLLLIIEDMIKHSDIQNFKGYTDSQQLAEIIKSVRNKN